MANAIPTQDVQSVLEPGLHAAAVTPADDADLTPTAKCLLIATGGDIKITTEGGDEVTLTVPAGYLLVKVTRVWATGTTATGITAIW